MKRGLSKVAKDLEKARTRPMPAEWLKDAITNFKSIDIIGDTHHETEIEAIMDDILLYGCLFDTHSSIYSWVYFVNIKESTPNCIDNDCWFDNNRDRVDEYESTLYYAFDPDIHYCKVCFHHNKNYDWFDTDVFLPKFRAALLQKR